MLHLTIVNPAFFNASIFNSLSIINKFKALINIYDRTLSKTTSIPKSRNKGISKKYDPPINVKPKINPDTDAIVIINWFFILYILHIQV